jgi:hypothetical protein
MNAPVMARPGNLTATSGSSRRVGVLTISALASLLLSACDATELGTAASTVCIEVGAQCQLPTGPLGVCERTQCAAGATPPCFECISQH